MSSGHAACVADVIDAQFIIDTCPIEFEMFLDAMSNKEKEISKIARDIMLEENIDDEIETAYNNLISSFKNKTKLELEIAYHDSENDGDCYDDVDGVFWCVTRVWKLTPAGKKYNNFINRKLYVTYG